MNKDAAKFKKELGGYLDQELTNPIIEDTPIDSAVVPQTQFGRGGKLRQYQDGGQIAFNPPIMIPLKSGRLQFLEHYIYFNFLISSILNRFPVSNFNIFPFPVNSQLLGSQSRAKRSFVWTNW